MPWPEAMAPVRMERIALLAPSDTLRDALVRVADAGVVQFDDVGARDDSAASEAAQRLQRIGSIDTTPVLSAVAQDLDALERAGRADLLAGEAQLDERAAAAVHRDGVAALTGWCPASELDALAVGLGSVAAAVVPLPRPPGVDPPTLLGGSERLGRSFAPLVRTFGTVPYRDIDPTIPAGIAYVVMFGMMFGDAGHGALLIAIALLLRSGRIRRFAGLRHLWVFIAGAGIAATAFGALYGEFFGPTGVLPVLWLAPLDDPVRLLAVAVGVGAVFLAVSYAMGIVNRWREGGTRLALYAPSGIAGATLFLGAAIAVAGLLLPMSWLVGRGGGDGVRRVRARDVRTLCGIRRRANWSRADRGGSVRLVGATGVQPCIVRPPRRVRDDPCGARMGGVAGHGRVDGSGHTWHRCGRHRFRRRQRDHVRTRGARRGCPGPSAGVL